MVEDNEKDKLLYVLAQGNIHRLYVLKKTERIAIAVLLIADRLDPSRPSITHDLEEKAGLLIGVAIDMLSTGRTEILEKNLLGLAALLEVGTMSNRTPQKSSMYVANECYKLVSFMADRKNELSGAVLLGTPFFEMDDMSSLRERSREWNDSVLFGSPVDQKSTAQSFSMKDKNARTPTSKNKNGEATPPQSGQSRRENILALIQQKGRVSIKDISREIKNCSEKTIQRELTALVATGVLKKEGERRWSTYLFPNSV